jgi:hypothetical protein
VSRLAAPVNEYINALVIAEQQQIQFRKLEDLSSWPKAQELADLQARIDGNPHHRHHQASRPGCPVPSRSYRVDIPRERIAVCMNVTPA